MAITSENLEGVSLSFYHFEIIDLLIDTFSFIDLRDLTRSSCVMLREVLKFFNRPPKEIILIPLFFNVICSFCFDDITKN